VGKISDTILAPLWTKVHKIFRRLGDSRTFQRPRPIVYVSFRRYSPLSLEVVENRTNVEGFWPPIFLGRTSPTFLWQTVSVIYCPPFDKVWLSSVC